MTRLFCRLALVLLLAGTPLICVQPALLAADSSRPLVPRELENLSLRFFTLLTSGDVDGAFAELLKNSPIAENREQVQNLVYQTNRTVSLYGEMKGHELVSADLLGESFIRLRYIALHESFPVRWILTYYKSPSKGWLITNIKFDDRAEDMFGDE